MATKTADKKPADFTNSRNRPASAYGTLPNEQIRNEPLPQGGGFEKMARRRYQKPTPERRGSQWTILVREDVVKNGQRKRKVMRVPLGPSALTRAEAERLRDEYLAAINQAQVGIGGAILFRDFVRVYERDVLPTLASTTRERSKSVLKNHLNPEFGDRMLREITLEGLQGYFVRLQATALSAESVDKIRDVLSSVLGTAVDYGRLSTNPCAKIAVEEAEADQAEAVHPG